MGIIVELPCEIGDYIYEIIVDELCKEVYFDQYDIEDVSIMSIKYGGEWRDRDELGKEIFLNKEIPKKIFENMKMSDKYKDYTFFELDNKI